MRIKRKIWKTRVAAKPDIFNYIEFFYNPKRRFSTYDGMSPKQYEKVYW